MKSSCLLVVLVLALSGCSGGSTYFEETAAEPTGTVASEAEPESVAAVSTSVSESTEQAMPVETSVPDSADAAESSGFCVEATVASDMSAVECEVLKIANDAWGGAVWTQFNEAPTDPCVWGVSITCNSGGIEKLVLSDNGSLSGEIPAELGQLSNLEELVLSSNSNWLSGEIPAELGQLSNLKRLNLENNWLSGEIPPELGQLSNLKSLSLNGNVALSGVIPAELGQLSNLRQLYLGHNMLSGEIPPELGQLSNLTEVWLGRNSLSGGLPAALIQTGNVIVDDANSCVADSPTSVRGFPPCAG